MIFCYIEYENLILSLRGFFFLKNHISCEHSTLIPLIIVFQALR